MTILILIPTVVTAFQHSSFSIHPNTKIRNGSSSSSNSGSNNNNRSFILHSSSFSQESTTATTTTSAAVPTVQITTASASNSSSSSKKKPTRRNRRRRTVPTPPSQDINFLLKRTQYLLDLTPSSLMQGAGDGAEGTDGGETTMAAASSSQQHQHQHQHQRQRKIKIHRHTFHWLIDAWANSYHPNSTSHAHALLNQMIALSSSSSSSSSTEAVATTTGTATNVVSPNVQSYTKVINAYSKQGKQDSGDRAFELLQQMVQSESESESKPDHNEIHQSNSNSNSNSNTNVSKPNVITYTSVLEAYANSGTPEAAAKAEELCMDMISNSNSMAKNGNQDDDIVRPTTRSYNAVIQAYAKSGLHNRAEKAEAFIAKMESIYKEQEGRLRNNINNNNNNSNNDNNAEEDGEVHNNIIRPNTINYNTVLTTYANSGMFDAAEHTERILKTIMREPNVISYNACIDAWAKSGHADSGQRAFDLLQEMNDLYGSGQNVNVKPNTRSYNSVMNAYAKSTVQDGPQKAEMILDTMEELFEGGNADVKPDFFSFATVINAWGRSYQYGKAQRVLNIFRHMIDLYEKGNECVRPNGMFRFSLVNVAECRVHCFWSIFVIHPFIIYLSTLHRIFAISHNCIFINITHTFLFPSHSCYLQCYNQCVCLHYWRYK